MITTNPFFSDLAAALDPVDFARQLGFDLDPWQRDLLLSAHKRILLLASRQVGKSVACAILALHHALNNSGSLVLVLSPSLRQSSELFKRITEFYRDVGRPVPAETETALTMRLSNGSRIVSLPGNEQTIRGYSGVSLLLIDEAALVDDNLYRATRPMLAVSDGRLIAMGTPHGRRGWFYSAYTEGDQTWKLYEISAEQCPRISKAFLKEERRALGDHWYEQEYLCKWHESETSLFRSDVIRRAVRDFDELDLDLGLDEGTDEPKSLDYCDDDFDLKLD
jgi:hypothetical protein